MEWLIKIINNPVLPAHLALLFALVIWLGVKLGKIKLGGISLGVTFVLFVGILAGHLYHTFVVAPSNGEMATAMANQTLIINFIKEFGLVLFVYCIGLQVGPGFFATFKKGGVEMNLLSTALIVLNIAVMLALYFMALLLTRLVWVQPITSFRACWVEVPTTIQVSTSVVATLVPIRWRLWVSSVPPSLFAIFAKLVSTKRPKNMNTPTRQIPRLFPNISFCALLTKP